MSVALVFLLLVAQPRSGATIEVVARTPADHVGEDRDRATANVHSAAVETEDVAATEALVRAVPGLNINDVQHNPLQADISYRGFTASPLLGTAQGLAVFVDGVRLNEPFGDVVNWGFLPSTAIERIDLIPGANPAFGLNSLGGAIVLRTRSGATPEQRVDLSAGSFGSAHAAAIFGRTKRAWRSFATVDHLRDDGWREHSPSRATRGFGSIDWTGRRTTADLRGVFSTSTLTGNGPAPVDLLRIDRTAVFTHPDITDTTGALLSSRASLMISSRSLLQTTAYVRSTSTSTLNGDESPFDDEQFEAVNNRTRSRQRTGGFAAELDWSVGPHQLLAGAAVDTARSRFGIDVELAEFTDDRGTIGSGIFVDDARVDLRSQMTTMAVFAADRFAVTPALDLTFAARYNRVRVTLDDQIGHELDGRHAFGHLNVSVGVLRALGGGMALFANAGRSTRVPTPVELTCADPEAPCRLPNAFVSDPPLDPVRTTSLEAGIRGGGRVSWSAALFHATNDDDILFVSSGRARGEGHFENVGRTLRRGIEIGAQTSRWHASYALVDATFGDAFVVANPHHPVTGENGDLAVGRGSRIPSTPRHVAKAGAALRFGGTTAGIDGRYVSSQFVRGDEANLAQPIAAYWTADVRAERAFSRSLSLFASIENVFNAEYETFGLFGDPEDVLGDDFDDPLFLSPGAPRSVRIGARVRF